MFSASPEPGWRTKGAPTYTVDTSTLISAASISPAKASSSSSSSSSSSEKTKERLLANSNGIETFARIQPPAVHGSKVLVEYAYQDNIQDRSGHFRSALELKVPDDLEATFSLSTDTGILRYEFDKIFDVDATQSAVFGVVAEEKVLGAFDGINSTIFAYGQTGSGKTYTVFGGESFQDRGLIPRSIACLFKEYRAKKNLNYSVRCRVSFTEVYKETVYDLLEKGKAVQIFEGDKGVVQRNVSVFDVESEDEALSLFFLGTANRHTAPTTANEASSRSHAVFTLVVECKGSRVQHQAPVFTSGRLTLVDLAGSGRGTVSSSPKKETMEETKAIHVALHHLENVITSLRPRRGHGSGTGSGPGTPQTHVPYRNCTLTSLLRDSLGGNCRTAFILHISADRAAFEETTSTCRFGQAVGHRRVALLRSPLASDRSGDDDRGVEADYLRRHLEKAAAVHRTEATALQRQLNEAREASRLAVAQRDLRIAALEGRLAKAKAAKQTSPTPKPPTPPLIPSPLLRPLPAAPVPTRAPSSSPPVPQITPTTPTPPPTATPTTTPTPTTPTPTTPTPTTPTPTPMEDVKLLQQKLTKLELKQVDDRRATDTLKRTADAAAARNDELEHTNKELVDRVAALESHQTKVENELAAARAANLALGAAVKDLQGQVEAGKVKIKAVEGGAKVDAQTIRDLRSKLGELQAKEAQEERADSARLADLQRVNQMLKEFVADAQFQIDLSRPLVKVALDCWSGENIQHIPEASLEAARYDEGVVRLYPRLKQLEKLCDDSKIRLPVDHIERRQTELSVDAVTFAFGPKFAEKHTVKAP